MNKKVLSVALASSLVLLAVPFAASAQAAKAQGSDQNFNASQIRISGAIDNPGQPDPKDGILGIDILSGKDCSPDVHSFDMSATKDPYAHITFAVQATPEAKSDHAPSQDFINQNTTVDVLIYGAGGQLVETVKMPHNDPNGVVPHKADSNTGNQFYVRCVWLNNQQMADAFGEKLLPTGDYTYKFKATFTDPNSGYQHVRTWVPSNNTFTIFDSSKN
jgi:hypothetical protein